MFFTLGRHNRHESMLHCWYKHMYKYSTYFRTRQVSVDVCHGCVLQKGQRLFPTFSRVAHAMHTLLRQHEKMWLGSASATLQMHVSIIKEEDWEDDASIRFSISRDITYCCFPIWRFTSSSSFMDTAVKDSDPPS